MTSRPDARWFGDRAVLVSVDDGLDRTSVSAALISAFPTLTVRFGMRSVLVESSSPSPSLLDDVRHALEGPASPVIRPLDRRTVVEIDVVYDGIDLAEVADALAISREDVVERHSAQEWRVAMMGFAPGFGYLVPGGPQTAEWSKVTRLGSPRAEVPAGSVAVAAGMSAIYPARMPGGWRVIGRTEAVIFDAHRTNPSLLTGDAVVRFRVQAR